MRHALGLLFTEERSSWPPSKLVPSGSPDLGTRGAVGGPGTPQDQDTSLSDVVRSGSAPASFQATLASLYGPEFAQAVGNISPTAFFNSLTKLGLSASDANDVMKAILSNPTPDLPLGGGTVGDAIPEAGAGLGGDVSLGGNAAAFAGAVLTEIGQATDNPDLAKAGEALSAAGGAVGTAASETAARGGS